MRKLMVVLVTAAVAAALTAVPVLADGTVTLHWGKGPVETGSGQCMAHWVATPGGNNRLLGGHLEVQTSGPTLTASGYFPGGDRGALHFDTYFEGGLVLESAKAEVEFEGEAGNMGLQLSHVTCEQATPTATATATATPTDTPTPTPTATPSETPTPETPTPETPTPTGTPGPPTRVPPPSPTPEVPSPPGETGGRGGFFLLAAVVLAVGGLAGVSFSAWGRRS